MAAPYTVRWSPGAQRELDALPNDIAERVLRAIARLAQNPQAAPNVKALRGGGFRLRVGDWRVIYGLREAELAVLVIRVAHRREVYR